MFNIESLFKTNSPVKNGSSHKFASEASEQCSETDVQPTIEVKHRCEHPPTCEHEYMHISNMRKHTILRSWDQKSANRNVALALEKLSVQTQDR